jgi:hypothetical protein
MRAILLIIACMVLVGGLIVAFRRTRPVGSPACSALTWQSFRSPAGFYTVEHPTSWHVAREENTVNITPKDGSGAVTISAYRGEPPIPDFMVCLQDSFEGQTPTSELTGISRNGWTGVTQTFRNSKDGREWIAILAQKGKVFVFITVNEEQRRMADRRATYDRVLQSVKLSDE